MIDKNDFYYIIFGMKVYFILFFILFLGYGCSILQKQTKPPAGVVSRAEYFFPNSFSLFSSDNINLSAPNSVVQYKDKYYVADTGHGRICVYDLFGTFKGILSIDTSIILNEPKFLYVYKNDLYIMDSSAGVMYAISFLDGRVVKKIEVKSSEPPGKFVISDDIIYQIFGDNKLFFYKIPSSENAPAVLSGFTNYNFKRLNDILAFKAEIVVADLNRALFFKKNGKIQKKIFLPEFSNLSVIRSISEYDGTLLFYNSYVKKIYIFSPGLGFKKSIIFNKQLGDVNYFIYNGKFLAVVSTAADAFYLFTTRARKMVIAAEQKMKGKDYKAAIDLLEGALSLNESPFFSQEIKEKLGTGYFLVGRYNEALKYLNMSKITPDMRLTLSKIYNAEKKYAAALKILEPLEKRVTNLYDTAILNKALIYSSMGEMKQGLGTLERGLRRHPNKVLVAEYIDMSSKTGRLNRMVSFLKMIYGKSRDKAVNLIIAQKIADTAFDMADYKLAVGFYKELINKFYDNVILSRSYRRLAESFLKQQKDEDAIEAYKMLLYVDKNYDERIKAKFMIAEIYFNLLEFDSAQKYYIEIVNKYPDSDFFTKAIWRLAEMQSTEKKYDKAIHFYKEYYKFDKHTERGIVALFNIAEIYFRTKRYDSAVEYYQKILLNYPGTKYEPNILQRLGNIYEIKGDRATAASYYDKLLKNYPELGNYSYIMKKIKVLRGKND